MVHNPDEHNEEASVDEAVEVPPLGGHQRDAHIATQQRSRRHSMIIACGPGISVHVTDDTAHHVVISASMRSLARAFGMSDRDAASATVLPALRPPTSTVENVCSRTTLTPRSAGGKWHIVAAEYPTKAEAERAAAAAATVTIAGILAAFAPADVRGGGVAIASVASEVEQVTVEARTSLRVVSVATVGEGEAGIMASRAAPHRSSSRHRANLLHGVVRAHAVHDPKVDDRDRAVAAAAMLAGC